MKQWMWELLYIGRLILILSIVYLPFCLIISCLFKFYRSPEIEGY